MAKPRIISATSTWYVRYYSPNNSERTEVGRMTHLAIASGVHENRFLAFRTFRRVRYVIIDGASQFEVDSPELDVSKRVVVGSEKLTADEFQKQYPERELILWLIKTHDYTHVVRTFYEKPDDWQCTGADDTVIIFKKGDKLGA